MGSTVKIILILHVTAGFSALVSGALAILLKRNTPKHKPVGRIYFWCMSVIFATGIFLSVLKGLLFFFFIAIFSYYSTVIAYRALRLKKLHEGQKPAAIDWLTEIIAALTFFGMIVFGLYLYFKANNPNGLIPFIFGSMGLLGVYRNSRRLLQGPKETLYWLKTHIGNMLGSYIGAITAFVVNQSDKIPVHPVALWLGPTVILVPVIVFELKKIKTEPIEKAAVS
ncbi:MAG: hypothetical protein ACXVPQ_03785 [Bacteroidia bacterium]